MEPEEPVFDHAYIDKYTFEEIPLDQDLYLMDEKWMREYDAALTSLLSGGDFDNVGYISYAAARSISEFAVELSWYPNVHTRFHEVRVSLPHDQFVCCVGCWRYDEKPHIFVRSAWLHNLHLRSYSVFALVDAIGVKAALERGELSRDRLIALRDEIDRVASRHPNISFISFADSLLLKSNWSVGSFDSHVTYTYEPEIFIQLIAELQTAYHDVLGLPLYAVLTQGSNEYYDDPLLHISATRNHISLNSLGLPFAQLMEIDHAARQAIRNGLHAPGELYMEENFFRSLSLAYEFRRDEYPARTYHAPMMTGNPCYYVASCRQILDNLRRAT
jgi:hypothetical protein